ncbi:putative GTP cyclohydrolase-2 [Cyphellophora attinorum]|uniref:GTP cyclohydrolase II n=1 Tax=Cyphellophora attinorum TaxID=1664694 RepID=A0A0N0NHI2_9EURO|nr:putative GTP cyclohydrolase-2 [Phialophora attinorum]KPI34721.1 putative GTP cyclohydrolase-2 [Phialophora attinorum]
MATHTTADLPPHHSPDLPPTTPLAAPVAARPSSTYFKEWTDLQPSGPQTPAVPGSSHTGASTPSRHLTKSPKSTPVDTSLDPPTLKQPRLVPRLPKVECVVRARIPTTSGAEMFLHLYQNDSDDKEHLAIVFGGRIRSKSLDREREGESEMDRMIRGAYVGRLTPGRTSSRVDADSKRWRPAGAKRQRSGTGRSALRNVETPETLVEGETLETARLGEQAGTGNVGSMQRAPPASATSQLEDGISSLSLDHNDTTTTTTNAHNTTTPRSKAPLVRIHSECYTGETAWSARCDCGEQLDEAARLMSLPSSSDPNDDEAAGGVIVYLRQEGRGIGLASKLKAYNLQDLGNDTVEANLLLRHPADARTYGLATAILCDLGLGYHSPSTEDGPQLHQSAESMEREQREGEQARERGIRLLTNNPDKVRAVEGPNKEVRVRERVAMVPIAWRTGGHKGVKGVEIEKYLDTKIRSMGHMIHE